MKFEPYFFETHHLFETANAIGVSLIQRMRVRIYALTLQTWHCHLVCTLQSNVPDIVKCAKEAARYHLRPQRPIWTAGYDERACSDIASLRTRVRYVERHNLESKLPAKPWDWIVDIDSLL